MSRILATRAAIESPIRTSDSTRPLRRKSRSRPRRAASARAVRAIVRPVAAVCWTAYVAANGALAWVLVRFTASYGSLPASSTSDALFVRLIGTLAAQPIMTALAFSVLTRVMGMAWHPLMPGLPAVQEGI